jgi:rare lipoprotein A
MFTSTARRTSRWWLLVCLGVAMVQLASAQGRRTASVQTGYATYYARTFHGQETASGTTFNANAMVAAHRTLPFDSLVEVVNLENGRRVRVRIVDRGPYGENYREGTIIDVSPAAGRRLGMIEDGQVRVRVRVIARGPDER